MIEQKKIEREAYLKKLIAKRDNGLVKVITGVRRCGKSYLLFTLYRQYLWSAVLPKNRSSALRWIML